MEPRRSVQGRAPGNPCRVEAGRGRPPVEQPKVHIGLRLSADVVKGVRATGPGYNARVDRVLREALAKGEF